MLKIWLYILLLVFISSYLDILKSFCMVGIFFFIFGMYCNLISTSTINTRAFVLDVVVGIQSFSPLQERQVISSTFWHYCLLSNHVG